MFFKGGGRWVPVVQRLLLGGLLVIHGAQKLFGVFGGRGIAANVAYFERLGLTPALFWTWVVIGVEFFGGIGLVIGLLTRLVAAAFVIEMIVAIVKVNWARGFLWTAGGFEGNLLFAGIALCLFLSGPGPLSVDRALRLERPPGGHLLD